ncbi:OmpA family protein [Oscillospiraceae bacterium OttesenSCG-928-G22]|nr:OmpA family protein [Oscillospiraceae bacterium OttesenSCG-928-G22]
MARKKSEPPQGASAPLWMATYGDMITLVLVFFVLLYSFSTIDADKWRQLVESFTGVPSIFEEPDYESMIPPLEPSELQDEYEDAEIQTDTSEWGELYHALMGYVEENDLTGNLDVTVTDYEMMLRFTDNILFDSGRADLREDAAELVREVFQDVVAQYLEELEYIRIEGHTDSRPIHTSQFRDNWDLSTARASTVHRYLLANVPEIQPAQLFYGGYGEYRPVAPNDSDENMALNRRVDIILIRPIDAVLEEQRWNQQGASNE